jgi:hypothetical protein
LQEDGNNTVDCIVQFEQLHPLLRWEKNDCATPTTLEESDQSNTFSAANSAREYAHDKLQFFSIYANLPRPSVEHPAAYALSRAPRLSSFFFFSI